jgi:nucleoside 2-deoxyribosyltransferase
MARVLIPAISGVGIEVVNPWRPDKQVDELLDKMRDTKSMEERSLPWRDLVNYAGERNATDIKKSDGIVAVLDGTDVDSGTAAEVGYGAALGKWIVGYRQDLRRTGDDVAADVNLQVEYFVRANGGDIVHNIGDLRAAVQAKTADRSRKARA